jgi:hypothetical protein
MQRAASYCWSPSTEELELAAHRSCHHEVLGTRRIDWTDPAVNVHAGSGSCQCEGWYARSPPDRMDPSAANSG